jgi:hypothetical protein
MIAFYVSLALLGAAIISQAAVKSRRAQRLQPVRVHRADRRIR